MGYGAFM